MAKGENPIFQGYTPEEQAVVGEVLSSPLSRLILDIELAKEGVRKADYGKGARNISKALSDPYSAERAIERNDEFRDLWIQPVSTFDALLKNGSESTRREWNYYTSSKRRYLDILKNGNFQTKLIATSKPFKEYMRSYGTYHVRGPFFLRVLSALPAIDREGVSVLGSSPQELANLDQQYFWLRDRFKENGSSDDSDDKFQTPQQAKYAEDCRIAFGKFKNITNQLLNIVFDSKDQSEWKQYVVSNFRTLAHITGVYYMPVEDYDPDFQYYRLKNLFDNSSDDVREFLAPYVSHSRLLPLERTQEMDDEILAGNWDRALDYTRYWVNASPSILPFFDVGERQVYDFWSSQFIDGNIENEQLETIPENVYEIYKHVRKEIRPKKYQNVMADFCISEGVSFGKAAVALLEKGIFPTPELARFVQEHGAVAFEELDRLAKETSNGKYDSRNPIQRDLEYTKYVGLIKDDELATYKNFLKIPFDPDLDNLPTLDLNDSMEARAAALEAARVFWIVKERVDAGRSVLVVGNERYGKLFVVDPLKIELDSLGVKTVSSYLRSGTGDKEYDKTFDEETLEYIAHEQPDIIVVDGTSSLGNQERARYSRAMRGFYNWSRVFNAGAEGFDPEDSPEFNPTIPRDEKYWNLRNRVAGLNPTSPYILRFRSAYTTDQVLIGDIPIDIKADKGTPQLIIVNSTTEPKQIKNFPPELSEHKPAYYDDLDTKTSRGKKLLILTEKGLQEADTHPGSLPRYISAVQKAINEAIPEMIMSRASDPDS